MNAMTARLKEPGIDAPPEPTEVELLRDIRDALTSQGR
jgi:large-conductance mechanosensitive channel